MDFSTLSLPGPAGRADAIRATLTQIAALPGAAVPMHELGAAFARLTMPQWGDSPAVTARRQTCRELAHAIEVEVMGADCDGSSYAGRDPRQAWPWFQAQIDAWASSADPRQATMAATAARELAELGGLSLRLRA